MSLHAVFSGFSIGYEPKDAWPQGLPFEHPS